MQRKNTLHWMLAGLLITATSSLAFAAPDVEIRQKNGSTWRGELSDIVRVTFLRSGRQATVEGELIRAETRFVQIMQDDGQKATIFSADIVSITTIGAATPTSSDDDADADMDADDGEEKSSARRPIVSSSSSSAKKGADAYDDDRPGVFVLPMHGTLGVEFRAEEVRKLVEEVDKYGPGQIIVFEVNSPGGAVTEGEALEQLLSEVRKRHRLIAWIEEAISGGCAFSICCPEIYFKTEGTAGSVTAFSGTTALKGAEMEAWIKTLGDWMEEGGRNRLIAGAMVHAPLQLSYDKDPQTGEVTFYGDLSGEYILSRSGENLTFNSSNAVHSGFADGVADTYEQMAKLLDLPEWHEKSDYGRQVFEDWQDTVEKANEELPRLIAEFNNSTGVADGQRVLGKRLQVLKRMISWRRRAAVLCDQRGIPPTPQLERMIVETRRDLRRFN